MGVVTPFSHYHGVCYYPELWPEADLERDLGEMARLGINLVRMGEFSWAQLEPEEGRVSLDYFRRVLDRLHAAGLAVVWCTPTATPPRWLTYGHPDRCFRDGEGRVMSHGARQHVSYEHPDVRSACLRIVEHLGRELGSHPALVAWQIDNEFKCHVAEDFNPHAVRAWRDWLAKRYGTITALNAAWGTAVWSQTYPSFEHVPAPWPTPFLHNASLSTAWRQFSRERIADFLAEQAAVLRRFSDRPITHNLGLGFATDLERMSAPLDFVSIDDYPSSDDWPRWVFDQDLSRAAKPGQAHAVMETSVAHNGWFGSHEKAHPSGFLAAEVVTAFALGARTLCYWLWRQQRSGCELSHSAVMSAWFQPSVGHAELVAASTAQFALEPLLRATVPAPAEVAVTWSDRGRVMLEVEPLGAKGDEHRVDYLATVQAWHRRLCRAGVQREVRFEGAALTGLKLLFTPAMPAVDDAFLDRVEAWVRAGGTWVVGPLTGTRTVEHNVPTDAGLGARLERMAGVVTRYAWPLTGTGTLGCTTAGETVGLSGWCSALAPATPDTGVRGTLRSDSPADGLAWWTEHPLGAGRVVMLTAEPSGDTAEVWLEAFVADRLSAAGVVPAVRASPGTLVMPRVDPDGRTAVVVVNLDGAGGVVELTPGALDGISGGPVDSGSVALDRYGWRAWWIDGK